MTLLDVYYPMCGARWVRCGAAAMGASLSLESGSGASASAVSNCASQCRCRCDRAAGCRAFSLAKGSDGHVYCGLEMVSATASTGRAPRQGVSDGGGGSLQSA